jgi:HIV Tat-specific factor 1
LNYTSSAHPASSQILNMDASTITAMPSSVADFDADPRIHFNTVSGNWEFEDDDGNEMQWDAPKRAWVPIVSYIQHPNHRT